MEELEYDCLRVVLLDPISQATWNSKSLLNVYFELHPTANYLFAYLAHYTLSSMSLIAKLLKRQLIAFSAEDLCMKLTKQV